MEPECLPDSAAVRIHALLRQAELAQYHQEHRAMIEARQALQLQAPAVFRDYLLWLAARSETETGNALYM